MNIKKFLFILIFTVIGALTVLTGIFFASMIFMMNGNDDGKNSDVSVDKLNKKTVNILIMGTDNGGLRSDTIMLASLDSKNKKCNILSIPRDTRVLIGKNHSKINSALAIGKEDLSIKKVKELTGLPVNYYLTVNFKAFKKIIDLLGGVYIDVPQNMHYDDPVQDLYINLKKGPQLLDGNKAEQFVRFRHYPMGDLDRVLAQQTFIKALIDQKLKPQYISKIDDIFKEIKSSTKTNLSPTTALKYALMLKSFKNENIKMYELPGSPSYIDGISYFICDTAKTNELIKSTFEGK